MQKEKEKSKLIGQHETTEYCNNNTEYKIETLLSQIKRERQQESIIKVYTKTSIKYTKS